MYRIINLREVCARNPQSPGEIKRREVVLDFHRELDHPLLQVSAVGFRTAFVALLRTAVGTAISEVHKVLRTGGVPTSSTLLFWQWLTVSSVFTGRSARTSYSCLPLPLAPFSPPLISLVVSVDVKHHAYLLCLKVAPAVVSTHTHSYDPARLMHARIALLQI